MLGNRVRQLRRQKNMSLSELARCADLSKGMISQIENNKANPSVDSIRAIAFALDVPVFVLFLETDASANGLVRVDERRKLQVPGSEAERELLAPDLRRKLVPVIARLAPGKASSVSPVTHNGEECILILKGKISLQLGDDCYELHKGDAYSFDARLPHLCTNVGSGEAEYLSIATQDWGIVY